MDYKEKFEDFLGRMAGLLDKAEKQGRIIVRVEDLENAFPELKESEDERIRKALIKLFKTENYSGYVTLDGIDIEDAIAWLEKIVSPDMVADAYLRGCNDTEKKWLEKQGEQKPMKVYRVENEAEQKGLWRKFDGTWQPLFDMLTDGKCKDIPMEDNPIYREGGKRWFASAPSKEALQKWFSKRDLEELVSKGFTISEFEVVGYKKSAILNTYLQETILLIETILKCQTL